MSHGVSYSLFSHSSIVNNNSHLVDIICALESYVPLEEEDVSISRKISNSLILVFFFHFKYRPRRPRADEDAQNKKKVCIKHKSIHIFSETQRLHHSFNTEWN